MAHRAEYTPGTATLRRVFATPWVRAFTALLFILILGMIFHADGAFFRPGTHRDMLRHMSRYGILACGMTLVIVSAGIDLSVGSILGFTAVLFSLMTIRWGVPPWLAIPLCLAAGWALGSAGGAVIAAFRVQPFIATLAMMVLARGLAKWISHGQKVSTAIQRADGSYEYVSTPRVFELISARLFGGSVSVVTLIFLCCVIFCWILLTKLRWGRYLYAVGGNEEAARLSGVPVRGTQLLAYGLSGLFSALAGICQAAEELQGDPEAGQSYELSAIAIVVIGGTSLMGGRGGVGLTLLGALTIGYLEKILSINAVGEAHRLMLTGAIIVGAVLFQRGRKV
ncbi:MAG: ABC transporter permease [Lentisphaeria bacterium]|nr:ABC transporter permease [Lentisphaeria bacterium]